MGTGSATEPRRGVPPPAFRNQTFSIGVADMWWSIQRSAKGMDVVGMSTVERESATFLYSLRCYRCAR